MESKMLFGGVEGGATHSILIVLDETGKVLARTKGAGTNHWTLGIPECVNRIITMVHDVKDQLGVPWDRPLDCLGLTLSGCEQESSNAELVARVRDKDPNCAKEMYAASDTMGSLYTGAPDGGMVVIAGTGSNALLRTSDGEQFGCGGWGHLLGDEGGAYWIAHRAVKAVFDDIDGMRQCPYPTDRVWDTVRAHFNVDTRMDLLPHAYKDFQKSHFAGLTVELAYLANHGDRLSQQLFTDAGAALADHIAALLRHTDTDSLRIVCVGSVWKSWGLMQPGVLRRLAENKVKTNLELVRLRVSSAMGAAWYAARHIDHDMPRDDSEFCEVFYTYQPNIINVKHNVTNGIQGLENGTQDFANGLQSFGNGEEDFENRTQTFENGSHNLNNSTLFENGKRNGDHGDWVSVEH